ncbi:MAG: antA/AntB antirepressor family protein [Ideonella sp.]|nr:antA/AntB antirepressor family protein [Ideonella sp.]
MRAHQNDGAIAPSLATHELAERSLHPPSVGATVAPPAGLSPPDVKAPRAAGGGTGRRESQCKKDSANCQPTVSVKQLEKLLPIQCNRIGAESGAVLVSALHRALGIRKDFTNWAKHQFKRAMLVQGADFEVYAQKGENPRSGRPGTDWLISLDGAKHIALMSATLRGAHVRRYFIEAERELRRRTVAEYAQATEALGQLLRARQQLEADGSRAGRVLGSLRKKREGNDHAKQLQLDLIAAIMPCSVGRAAVEGAR